MVTKIDVKIEKGLKNNIDPAEIDKLKNIKQTIVKEKQIVNK